MTGYARREYGRPVTNDDVPTALDLSEAPAERLSAGHRSVWRGGAARRWLTGMLILLLVLADLLVSLPLFLDRLHSRLGEGTCSTGRHQPWPAAARYDACQGTPRS